MNYKPSILGYHHFRKPLYKSTYPKSERGPLAKGSWLTSAVRLFGSRPEDQPFGDDKTPGSVQFPTKKWR